MATLLLHLIGKKNRFFHEPYYGCDNLGECCQSRQLGDDMGTMVAEVQAGWVSCICPHWQCQGPNGTKLQTKGIAVIVIVIILAIDIIAIVVTRCY